MTTIRVLLVDNQPTIRQGLRLRMATEADIAVVDEAADGASALSLAAELAPDVVIMDVMMRSIDGIEATRRLRSATPCNSVVERRQQIGVLRALGYQPGTVSLSFLIETGFIVGMGVPSGTALGLVLARNMIAADDSASGFTVPWEIVSTILVATIVVALLMTWIPSRQASRIAPAEALRYE